MKSCFVALVLLALPAVAQQRQHFTINANTPEGQMLQAIGQETDEAKKLALMQDFLAKNPKHEGTSWVCALLETAYLALKDYDKALDTAEKGHAADPEDVDVAFNGIKAAEGKGDPDAIKTWAVRTSEAAHKATAKPAANDEEKQMADHAKDVGTYAEYALYSQALTAKDPKRAAEMGEALEKANPKSPYMWQVVPAYLRAEGGKACAIADRLAAADSKNAEAMLYSADCSWRANNPTKMVTMGSNALQALGSRTKVDGFPDGIKSASAQFYIGVGNSMQQRFGPAEKALRVALPAVKNDPTLGAYAYFHLGLSIYQLGKPLGDKSRMREGMQFFEQSAAIKSAVQAQASSNARQIRTELGGR